MDKRREAAAWLCVLPAALTVAYAAAGGVHQDVVVRWALAAGTVLGARTAWMAARQGPWALAWAGLALLVLPAALAWPAIGVSPGGLLALLALLVAAVAVAVGSVPARKPPALSPARP